MNLSKANAGALVRAIIDAAHATNAPEDISDDDFREALAAIEDVAKVNDHGPREAMLAMVEALRFARWGDPKTPTVF